MEDQNPVVTSTPPANIDNSLKSKLARTISYLKSLPVKTKYLLSAGMTIAILVAIPLTVTTLVATRTSFFNRAASGEFPATGEPPPTPFSTPIPQYYITIKQPNGEEILYVGQNYQISWNSSRNFDSIDIQYVTKSGFSSYVARNQPDTGSYIWNVNTLFPTETENKIYIYGYSKGYMAANDISDNYFKIVKSTATATPVSTPSACRRTPQTVSLTPASQTGNPGQALAYSTTIVNNDSSSCPSSTFTLTTQLPFPNWYSSVYNPKVTLTGGQTGSLQVLFGSSTSSAPGGYPVGVHVSNGQTATVSASAAYIVSGKTATATPTPRRTPTPTPIPTARVIISTSSLPIGQVNRPYSASVSAYDTRSDAVLNMTMSGLPKGLSMGPCTRPLSAGSSSITCFIKGTPLAWAATLVKVTASDNFGKVTTKYIVLFVSPVSGRLRQISPSF